MPGCGAPDTRYPTTQWLGAGLGGLALLWAVAGLLIRENVQPTSGAGGGMLAAAGVLALANLKAPGLAPATLLLLLGYGNGNRVLAGLGVAALLAATGLALLGARLVLQKCWPALQGENRHA